MGNLRDKYTDEEWRALEAQSSKEDKTKQVNREIYKCLNTLSNSVGTVITEYHWREFCGLMKNMEDERMIMPWEVTTIITGK